MGQLRCVFGSLKGVANDPPRLRRRFKLMETGKRNTNGGGRQEQLRRLMPGNPLTLRRDGDAVVAVSACEVPIGALAEADRADLPAAPDGEAFVPATLHQLVGGTARHANYQAWISVRRPGQPILAAVPLTGEQRAFRAIWRLGDRLRAVPGRLKRPAKAALDTSDPAENALSWKTTIVAIAVATLVMTAILILAA